MTDKKETRVPGKAGHVTAASLPKGSNGKPLCRQCGKECATSRNTFCSKDCVHLWKLTTMPSYQRQHVFKRDAGVCCLCGIDTVTQMTTLRAALQRACDALPYSRSAGHVVSCGTVALHAPDIATELVRLCISPFRFRHAFFGLFEAGAAWDMDHVLPVSEGGGGCGLENLRTLCLACHAAETRALRARTAKPKRERPARRSTAPRSSKT